MSRTARRFGLLPILALLVSPNLTPAEDPDWDSMPLTTHGTLQGVTSTGQTTFSSSSLPVKMTGVIINNYDEMLNNAANFISFTGSNFFQLGGEWQVYFQPIDDPADTSGSCLYMGQNYGTMMERQSDAYSYSNEDWEAEIARLSWFANPNPEDPTPIQLREGCLIEVHARAGREYRGKYNVNENHDPDPECDFDIVLLDPNHGLPAPIEIEMTDFMSGGTFLFDSTRTSGAELYQGRLVTLKGVTITSSENWKEYGSVTVSDGGQSFTVKLGYNEAFDTAALPQGELDITGVFDQEDPAVPYIDTYRMWATRPDAFAPSTPPLPGDANADGWVDSADASLLGAHWLTPSGASWFDGDFNGDRKVNDADAAILAAHWHQGIETAATPEPAASVLLAIGGLVLMAAFGRRRKCFPKR